MLLSQSLAPRSATTLDTVHDILGTLVARYRQDEVLTSVSMQHSESIPINERIRTAPDNIVVVVLRSPDIFSQS